MSFDRAFSEFSQRRGNFFQKDKLDQTFKGRIRQLKEQKLATTKSKPFVVISGAGPAGLIRAIQSISNGNPTKLIERRAPDVRGRINSVALTESTIELLKHWAIYPYLIENNLIYPLQNEIGYISVRITDLEKAMKAVLHELSSDPVIEYSTKIVGIDNQQDKLRLVTESPRGEDLISNVDIFVNAEGARSSTNELLGIERIQVLPSIPAIVALCRDDRPDIIDIDSFVVYVGKSFAHSLITAYYHTIFFFQYLFSEDFRTQIAIAIILPSPGQKQISCVFSDAMSAEFKTMKESKTEEEYQAFAEHWINLAICAANMISLASWFEGGPYLHTGHQFPINQFDIIQVGADYAKSSAVGMNGSKVILTGDASATVDPATALGCNTAIQSSEDFLNFILDFENPFKTNILDDYQQRTNARIVSIHAKSQSTRLQYRPDAVGSMSMFRAKPQKVIIDYDAFDPLLI